MGKRKTHKFELFVAVMVMMALGAIGCGQESSNALSPNALNNCAGEPDTDLDGICDKFDPDVNNPDLDDNNVLDGSQLGSLPTPTGSTGGGPGSVQPSGSGASTGNQLLTLAALAVLPRGSAGVSKFIGDTVLPEDEPEQTNGPTVINNINTPEAPLEQDLGDTTAANTTEASFQREFAMKQEGIDTSQFLTVDDDKPSRLFVVETQGCANGANYGQVFRVYTTYDDGQGDPVQHVFIVISYLRVEVINAVNSGGETTYTATVTDDFIDANQIGSSVAQGVIQQVLNDDLSMIENCSAGGFFTYLPAATKSIHRFRSEDPAWMGYTFDPDTNKYERESGLSTKFIFQTADIEPHLKEEVNAPQMRTAFASPGAPQFQYLRKSQNLSVPTAPFVGIWGKPDLP